MLKELVENSLDAGATKIEVQVEEGGVRLIRVADDGSGIAAQDLPLAFANHATSKLETADDLFRVHTLGFRGEALASIGGIAQVTLQSRPAGEIVGAEIECHGGEISAPRPWSGAAGTRIEVEGGTPEQRTVFYTALYHTLLQPNTFSDVDGAYRGVDGAVHRADNWFEVAWVTVGPAPK